MKASSRISFLLTMALVMTRSSAWAQENLFATVQLESISDSGVTGTASFQQQAQGVKVTATIQGLQANSRHGFHIHEFGDCGNKAIAAGEHYNPGNKPHGSLQDLQGHAGDLGNIEANADGVAQFKGIIAQEKLVKGAQDLIGRSLIIHTQPDDLKSQPSGDSGDRVACGKIIEALQGEENE